MNSFVALAVVDIDHFRVDRFGHYIALIEPTPEVDIGATL
jgi:hypothetical protein